MPARRSRSTIVLALVVASLVGILGSLQPGSSRPASATSTRSLESSPGSPSSAAYRAVGPVRLADTREPNCGCTRIDDRTIRVAIAGREGIGADIVAVAVTVTATASGAGFVTAYPSGQPRPTTSTLNLPPGADTSNSTIIPVGSDGSIELFASVATDLIVDVTGTFVAAVSSAGGRFRSTVPTRLLDTRTSMANELEPGSTVSVGLPAGVDADARGVVVNVTSVGAHRRGFLTGFATGTPAPLTSFINPDGSGAPKAASIVLPVSAQGFTISTSAGGHVVVDLVGWFTGESAPISGDGLLMPVVPTRVLDTRSAGPRLWPTGTREVEMPVSSAMAVITNVTMVQADTGGFVTASPAGSARPPTSSVNAAERGAVTPNLAITTVSERGVAYFSSHGTDLAVDLTGYFTGPAAPAPQPVPPNVAVEPTVLMVGDSTLGGLVDVRSAQSALRGFVPILDAKPCRRLFRPSCVSAFTHIAPNTAIDAIAAAPGPVDIVVIKTGYNDSGEFPVAVDRVMTASRAKGARVVIWLTYSESNKPGSYNNANALLRQLAGSAAYPDLVAADWRAYASTSNGWYGSDRVHLLTTGVWATADYISRWVAHEAHLPCPVPWKPGEAIDDPCPSPDEHAVAVGSTPALRSLYGF